MRRKTLGYSRAAAAALLGFIALANACGGNSDGGDAAAGTGGGSGSAGTTAILTGGSMSGGSVGTDGGAPATEGGAPASGGRTGASGSVGTSGNVGASGATGDTSWCDDGGCVCSNGLDDDGDGLVDGFDPECIGPTDNDEGSFATGIPGDNRDPKWQDCFFDGNSGAGDDRCRYSTKCLTGELDQDDPDCTVTQECLDYCVDRTPSGCDCFGCCTVGLGNGSEVDILTVSSCALDNIEDEAACPRCTKSDTCGNDCGECELCVGKTEADLPESCWPDDPPPEEGAGGGGGADGNPPPPPPPPNTCDGDKQVCNADYPCSTSEYCQLGCCEEFVR